jgi:hypothetical protein
MLLFDYVLVGDFERFLLIRKGRFEQILEPGEHIVFGYGVEFEKHDVRDVIFDSPWADDLAQEHPAIVERHFIKVEPAGRTVVVCFNGQVACEVAPGERMLFWRGPVQVSVRCARALSAVVCPVEAAHD